MKKRMICHTCSGEMKRGVTPVTFNYKNQSITLEQPGWYCGSCKESVISGVDIAATENAFLEFKAKVDGVLGPHEVKVIREQLKLSQRKASELLGGGTRSFQKYESGKVAVSEPMSNLLQLLKNDPTRLEEIVERHSLVTDIWKAS